MDVVYIFDTARRVRKVLPGGVSELVHKEADYELEAEVTMGAGVRPGEFLGFRCVDGRFRLFEVDETEEDDLLAVTRITATDAAAAELHGCFAENFRLIRGIAPEDFFADAEQEPSDEDEEISDEEAAANDIEIVHPDRFHALLLERLPALRTAAFADGEPFEEQSLADILTFIAAKDGALALSLWRALLDAADLTDPGEAEKVLWGLPELRGSHGACAPVLDEMEREPALAEQVFHAAVIGSPQRQLLLDCAEAGRTALLRRLWALLGTAPLPEAEWYFRKADLLRQLRKRDPEFDADA